MNEQEIRNGIVMAAAIMASAWMHTTRYEPAKKAEWSDYLEAVGVGAALIYQEATEGLDDKTNDGNEEPSDV
ncbi:MAG: hypothetical protein F4X54_10960 [Chloroflexi bacterium]|nr:hypothetical protein [Chloroflexota bacterium]